MQSDWASYIVSPSQAEQAAQTKFQEMVAGIVAAIVAVILAIILHKQRSKARSRLKSLTTTLPSTYNAFTTSVVLSIAVVGVAAYSITQFGHVWLGLISLIVVVELWGLADPNVGTLFGLFGSPKSGARAAMFDAFRTPGAPLLVSAYTFGLRGNSRGNLSGSGRIH